MAEGACLTVLIPLAQRLKVVIHKRIRVREVEDVLEGRQDIVGDFPVGNADNVAYTIRFVSRITVELSLKKWVTRNPCAHVYCTRTGGASVDGASL